MNEGEETLFIIDMMKVKLPPTDETDMEVMSRLMRCSVFCDKYISERRYNRGSLIVGKKM